ncbi:homoserine O-acetyltransferase MetX [Haloarchaeobius sp. HRN-SO-5]|uniref:homoserine O-acetyltransferase MetX n=1 Tax=Haloarchaeobius sp. HRN-SO-5 TaxID=3446118 RepID=UPI003EB80B3C
MATQDVASLGEFTFDCGESIPDLEIAYETYGEFEPGGDSATDRTAGNAVLVCHALTGSQHVGRRRATADGGDGSDDTAGQARAWWGDVVGPGKAIDTTEYYVVCANVPGSCYGSSGPASEGPDGEPWGTDFPPVTVGDWTRAQRRLLDHLGVGRLHAVVGGSVGGMNALDWAVRYPDDVERVGVVAAAPRLDAQCLALDTVARRAITTDPHWNGGDYYGDDRPDPDDGLAQARRIGHVMYLSKASMGGQFGRRAAGRGHGRESPDPAAAFFPYRDVESYLDYNAERFVERFDANAYLYLVRAMDDYDAAAGYESDVDALGAFDGELLCLSFTGDWHFTTEQSEALAGAARDADVEVAHHVVESDHGHDAFLVEPERVGPPLSDFLDVGVAGKAVTDTVDESVDEFAPVHTSLFGD